MPFDEMLLHALLHTGEETLRLLPFLYLTYLLMEFLEHRAGERVDRLIRRSGRVGPLLGGVCGMLPQCGFSAAAAGLYAGRLISIGTLAAVFLSTSDEMLPILLSHRLPLLPVLSLVAIKAGVAILVGFSLDLLVRPQEPAHAHVDELCRREGCHCEGRNLFLSALVHTLQVSLFLFTASFLLSLAMEAVGEETIGLLVQELPILGVCLAALVGLIPNCAASVILTELYLSGALSLGGLFSGLLVGAGVGLLVLFRVNRDLRRNLLFVAFLYVTAVLLGVLADLVGLGAWIGL